eukprot:IDg14631t1
MFRAALMVRSTGVEHPFFELFPHVDIWSMFLSGLLQPGQRLHYILRNKKNSLPMVPIRHAQPNARG